VTALTTDRFLGGRVTIRQPVEGFRAGLDAVMLAAAIPAQAGDEALELGAGSGTVSLCLAQRVPDCSVTGVEIDADLAVLANQNAAQNGFDARVQFVSGDVLGLPRELKQDFAHVFCNPPFHAEEARASPLEARDRALRDTAGLGNWVEIGLKRTVSGGTFNIILRADRMSEALVRLPERGMTIFPLWSRGGEPAKRVILQVRKGSRAESVLSPGLVLHEANGQYTKEADAVLREGAPLSMIAV
jgi:tRNA1Val (adenine37-N6)-methyltransferase